jgi:NADH-quinone oxidoreductase subunit J
MMLGFGTGVVLFRSPVSSAMCLVMSFIGLASLFITLDAYAGAVMVLFLFIIMLLDLKSEVRRRIKLGAFGGGLIVLAGFIVILVRVVVSTPDFLATKPVLTKPANDVAAIGLTLFTQYNLQLQIVGVLLLVATVGVVLLSKKELK